MIRRSTFAFASARNFWTDESHSGHAVWEAECPMLFFFCFFFLLVYVSIISVATEEGWGNFAGIRVYFPGGRSSSCSSDYDSSNSSTSTTKTNRVKHPKIKAQLPPFFYLPFPVPYLCSLFLSLIFSLSSRCTYITLPSSEIEENLIIVFVATESTDQLLLSLRLFIPKL